MDKELAVGLSPESSGQWLHAWMEISDEWYLQGSVLEAILYNISISDPDIVVKGTLSTFADNTKLWGAVSTPEGPRQA